MIEGLGYGRREVIKQIVAENWLVKEPEKINFTYDQMLFVIQELLIEEAKPYFENRAVLQKGFRVFKDFVKLLLYRNIANYDSMILISSEKGTGKSSAAIMIARYWCRLLGIKFDSNRHIAYSNADVINKIDNLRKFEPLICDEAVKFACISGNTTINTTKGNIMIKDLINKCFQVYSYNEEKNDIEVKDIGRCVKVKKDVVYEIETEDGKKIRATREHKFLTVHGWKMLSELKVGDDMIGV